MSQTKTCSCESAQRHQMVVMSPKDDIDFAVSRKLDV
jgi:hypothetical protein